MKKQSALDLLLIALRERPSDFELSRFTLIHKPSKVEIWISSGFFFFGFYDPGCPFNLAEKWRFGRAFGKWQREYLVEKMMAR